LCLHGDLLARTAPSDPDAVVTRYREAAAAAREMEARANELAAALRLGRWLAARGRPREAHALLAPLHAAFVEGLDTPDVCDARRFLAEIA
jgi:hypothetical protein